MFKLLKGKKTYTAATATVLGAAAAYYTGTLAGPEAAQLIVSALLTACLRSAVPAAP